jgi:hypothetical protein
MQRGREYAGNVLRCTKGRPWMRWREIPPTDDVATWQSSTGEAGGSIPPGGTTLSTSGRFPCEGTGRERATGAAAPHRLHLGA